MIRKQVAEQPPLPPETWGFETICEHAGVRYRASDAIFKDILITACRIIFFCSGILSTEKLTFPFKSKKMQVRHLTTGCQYTC